MTGSFRFLLLLALASITMGAPLYGPEGPGLDPGMEGQLYEDGMVTRAGDTFLYRKLYADAACESLYNPMDATVPCTIGIGNNIDKTYPNAGFNMFVEKASGKVLYESDGTLDFSLSFKPHCASDFTGATDGEFAAYSMCQAEGISNYYCKGPVSAGYGADDMCDGTGYVRMVPGQDYGVKDGGVGIRLENVKHNCIDIRGKDAWNNALRGQPASSDVMPNNNWAQYCTPFISFIDYSDGSLTKIKGRYGVIKPIYSVCVYDSEIEGQTGTSVMDGSEIGEDEFEMKLGGGCDGKTPVPSFMGFTSPIPYF